MNPGIGRFIRDATLVIGAFGALTLAAVGQAAFAMAGVAADDLKAVAAKRCGPQEVLAGTICIDKYEASVWRVPEASGSNAGLVKKIRLGTVARADLVEGGAIELGGPHGDDYDPCLDNGQNCVDDIFAVSLPSETPSASITWFQAQEACANSGKRLPTSTEWQVGVSGTPDPGPDNGTTDCNTASGGPASRTGARGGCISARGAFDMVGNVAEWVADWVPSPTFCPNWASFSDDQMCLAGASETANSPGALVRGGAFAAFGGPLAGPFAIKAFAPFHSTVLVGFRCAR